MPSRRASFAAVVLVCVLVAAVYTGVSASRAGGQARARGVAASIVLPGAPASSPPTSIASEVAAATTGPSSTTAASTPTSTASVTPMAATAERSAGSVVFLDATDVLHPHVAIAPLEAPDTGRTVSSLICQRVYVGAGHGVCLGGKGDLTFDDSVRIVDARLQPVAEYHRAGLPTRAGMSSNGRFAALTVFVAGDSYAGTAFSTRSDVIDTVTGHVENLENFSVTMDGQPFGRRDFNFWGTTFAADGNTIYATLGTGVSSYLVQGDLARRTVRVLFEGVECPSISPDGTRIAFKQRTGNDRWRLAVLDLGTMRATLVGSETRSVDDQAEWLDANHLLYGMLENTGSTFRWNVWVAALDGAEAPRVFLHDALSPSVVRAP